MIAEDFGPVYTRGQKTREGAASAVRHRHDHRHRGQTSETQELFDADKRPGEKCGLGLAYEPRWNNPVGSRQDVLAGLDGRQTGLEGEVVLDIVVGGVAGPRHWRSV